MAAKGEVIDKAAGIKDEALEKVRGGRAGLRQGWREDGEMERGAHPLQVTSPSSSLSFVFRSSTSRTRPWLRCESAREREKESRRAGSGWPPLSAIFHFSPSSPLSFLSLFLSFSWRAWARRKWSSSGRAKTRPRSSWTRCGWAGGARQGARESDCSVEIEGRGGAHAFFTHLFSLSPSLPSTSTS
jgi:hypothetical protein